MQLAVYALVVSILALAGFVIANVLYDRKVPNYLSRKSAHIFGGVAYLMAVWLLTPASATIVSLLFTLGLMLVRARVPHLLRGVGGTGRPHAFAEITYPLAGTVSIAVGWWWLGDKWLALVPILFMAWGDSVTGIVRSIVVKKEQKHWSGSLAMLAVSLMIAILFIPYWVGAAGAVVATITEKLSPLARGWLDDNPLIIFSALATMALLRAAV